MSWYVLRRLFWMLPVLLAATTLAFVVLHLVPGDPVNLMLAGHPASTEVRENLRKKLGLNKPVPQQYVYFLEHALRGNFGISFRTGLPVSRAIGEQLPASLQLAAGGMTFGILAGMGLGLAAGLRPNSWLDTSSMLVALAGISLPGYWTAMLLIYLFGIKLGLVPIVGGGWTSLILPSVVFGSFAVGDIARLVRASMLEVGHQDYIRTAKAKGLSRHRIVFRHMLRSALIPVVTVVGLQLGLFISGGVITETVFARPGIGALLVDAILEKDYPIVQAVIVLTTAAYIVANFAVDLLYGVLDPRVRYG